MGRKIFVRENMLAALIVCLSISSTCFAGVSRAVQDRYRRSYENKALFLKIPLFSDRQFVFITGKAFRFDTASGGAPARFKVGDQVRILSLDFGGEEIRFKVSAIASAMTAEVTFRFDESLQDTFPNSEVFDNALQATFTEGLKYTDLDEAKRSYVEDQFERFVRDVAATGGTTRDTVLKEVAPQVPAYQEALRDIDNLKSRNHEVSSQLAQSQAENRKLDLESRGQQAEIARLRGQVAALQEKIDSSTAQLSRLGEDLRSVRGTTQGYQREIANLQRSLNLKVDASRDLGGQISDLAVAMRKVQRDNESLESQVAGLRSNLENAEARIGKLTAEAQDLRASNSQMRETIGTLTSKEDSLARQYLQLKQAKENLENVTRAVDGLDTRVVEEVSEAGVLHGKAQVLLRNIPLGMIEYTLPERISRNEEAPVEARFTADSIDYVRLGPEERLLLRSLGDRLKLQFQLSSRLQSLEIRSDRDDAVQEIAERDRASWHWRIANKGTQDGRIRLEVRLINRHSDPIPVFLFDHGVASASVVRQFRSLLQPVPLSIGAVLGLILAAIVRLFFRPRARVASRRPSPPAHTVTKQL